MMKKELDEKIHGFFEQMDWPLFYQSKMAICEIMDHFNGSHVPEEKNAIEWMNCILGMMDDMEDIATDLKLLERPQWDDDINCLDDRYNHVLSKLPAGITPAPDLAPASEERDSFLVTLRRTYTLDFLNPETYEDDYIVRIPKSVKEEERTEYIENVFRAMAHEMMTGPNAVSYIRETNRYFNWGDFVNDVTNDIQEKYQCYDAAVPDNRKWLKYCAWNRIIIDVNQDEILLWEEEPCTIYLDDKAICEALANMVTGKVTCRQNIDLAAYSAAIVFTEGGKARFPLAVELSDTATDEKKDAYYWLGQK